MGGVSTATIPSGVTLGVDSATMDRCGGWSANNHSNRTEGPMMDTEQQPPMDGDQWAEASTRGALLAQLRGQREAGKLVLTELRECREEYHECRAIWAKQVRELSERAVVAEDAADDLRQENAHLRELLRPAFSQWGSHLRAELPDGKMLKVWFTVGELRQIAALFVEDE